MAFSIESSAEEGDPLEMLQQRIERAHQADRQETEPSEVDATNPLEALGKRIRAERREIGSRRAVPLPRGDDRRRTGARETTHSRRGRSEASESPDASLGREVGRILSEHDLPGPTRADVARRLADAIDDPDPEELREILRLVITGQR